MVKLLIIADDFTGALDTGVKFAKQGICTQVFTKQKLEKGDVKDDTEVLVVDTESRPMSAEEAYQAVYELALWAVSQGIETIFKKTDSALRGNIGAELQAVLDAGTERRLFFLPGYPQIGRITRNGIHYISGELLENSVFGRDPFEPVTKSYVPDIIHGQSAVPVTCVSCEQDIPLNSREEKEIIVCDLIVTQDIDRRLDELIRSGSAGLLAGCAALADRLTEKLFFRRQQKKSYRKTKCLYAACGSLNQITRRQVDYAEQKAGFIRGHLTVRQKLDPGYYETREGKEFLEEILKLCREKQRIAFDSFDKDNEKEIYMREHGISAEDMRHLIAEAHGRIVKEIINHNTDVTVLMTGGDTLMGYMKLINCTQLEPVCEIEQGVAVSVLEWNGCRQQVISKSGGFGTDDIMERIADKIIRS